jgi:hypothetical protein
MNPLQRIILAGAIVAIIAAALFPPWVYVYTPPPDTSRSKAERSAGYRLITSPPGIEYEQVMPLFGFGKYMKRDPVTKEETSTWTASLSSFSVRLNTNVLAIEMAAILLVTGLLYLLLRTSTKPAAH